MSLLYRENLEALLKRDLPQYEDRGTIADHLAGVIALMLHCPYGCKGKGTVYNPKGRDRLCVCRIEANRVLERYTRVREHGEQAEG